MKKFSFLAILLLATILIMSCTATKAEAPAAEPEAAAVAADAQAVTIAEPVEQPAAEPVAEVQPEAEPIVIDTAPGFSATDSDLDQTFSYVYGHLLASNVIAQDIELTPNAFIAGSADFFNYVEPKLSEAEINELFTLYQQFLDGTLVEADLEAQAGEPVDNLVTFVDKFSYGYGYVVQYNLQSQGILVDLESYHSGVADAFAGIELPYTQEEIDQLFTAYQEKLMSEYESMVAEYANENLVEAETFLAENASAEGVVTTGSGLQYKVMRLGEGALPADEDTVKLDYMITFLDGTTGDNSYSRGEPSVFNLANLIPGFSEGVKLMPVGSHYRFYVHPSLAYGETGNEMIPPNTLLIFDVELHEIVEE